MKKNDLIKSSGSIFRVLERKGDEAFIINCVKRTMPRRTELSSLYGYESCTEEDNYLVAAWPPIFSSF